MYSAPVALRYPFLTWDVQRIVAVIVQFGNKGRGKAGHACCPISNAHFQLLFRGDISTRGYEVVEGLTHCRAAEKDR